MNTKKKKKKWEFPRESHAGKRKRPLPEGGVYLSERDFTVLTLVRLPYR